METMLLLVLVDVQKGTYVRIASLSYIYCRDTGTAKKSI